MIRKLCLMALGLSLCATLSIAQAPDSLAVPAALPRTEAEFLARYGTSDSNRALIPYWFAKRNRASEGIITGSLLSVLGGGLIVNGFTTSQTSGIISGQALSYFFGGVISLVGVPVLVTSSSTRLKHSLDNLDLVLREPSTLPERDWQKAMARLAATTYSSARVVDRRTPQRAPGNRSEFLDRYGSSDSLRALINVFYARRRTYSWLVGGIATVAVGGFTYANVVSSGLDEQNLAPIGGFAFLVGTPAFFIAKARLKRYSRAVLYRYVEHPDEVPPRLWQAARKRAAKSSR